MRTINKETMSRDGSGVYPGRHEPLTHDQRGRISELVVMVESQNRGCPEFWADLAQDAEALADLDPQHYLLAAELWARANSVTMGSKRAERYEHAAHRCKGLAPKK